MLHARIVACLALVSSSLLYAGGPRLVAGSTYFDPAVMGQPVRWAGGQVNYYVDPGPLSATVSHAQAVAMVDAAAALWSAVPTAAVALVDKGTLKEDVSGFNVVASSGTLTQPSDVAPGAVDYPLAVIFDTDGSVIDALLGATASDPLSCHSSGVLAWTDNVRTDATAAHAVIVVNGRCTSTNNRLQMMNFLLERAFGLVLGLGHSQVFPDALTTWRQDEAQAWPVMQPGSGACNSSGGRCIPNLSTLQPDDVAELNRLYPVTADNQSALPGKLLTAANTVSISGVIRFRSGVGMQGVNVVAMPLGTNGNPMPQYAVTAVSGAQFRGDHGNPVTGWTDNAGVPLSQYGSTDPDLQGVFDLAYLPLPPGMTSADWQLTFEPIDPLYMWGSTVGPYNWGSPLPSGTLVPVKIQGLALGASKTASVDVADSAAGDMQDAISTEQAPRLLPTSGFWSSRLGQVEQTDWFNFPVRGNRLLTIVTVAVDEFGLPSGRKAMPSIGAWDAFDPVGAASIGYGPALNGFAAGETWLRIATDGDDILRIGIADLRGDGRPDYNYNGWVLYADSVQPARLPLSGGPIVIHGMGFRASDTVLVGGRQAQVTGISPNEITAIAPGVQTAGSADVEVDDLTQFYAAAMIGGGISYDSGSGFTLAAVDAPANSIPIGVPAAFAVAALGPDLEPAPGLTITYKVTAGTATLACGRPSCSVSTGGDGAASLAVTPVDATSSTVSASLSNGAQVKSTFRGGTPPKLAALTPSLSLAAGAKASWTTQALVLNGGVPQAGQLVSWQTGTGFSGGAPGTSTTGANGIAAKSLSAGPLVAGQNVAAKACLNGTSQCVSFTATGSDPAAATLSAVSGTSQSLALGQTPAQIVLRVRDASGNPLAGATVTLSQALYAWAPPCPPHGRCAQSELLSMQSASGVSAVDGSIAFSPAGIAGVATNTLAVAATGDSSAVNIAIEQHP
jgi:hypothetical protein